MKFNFRRIASAAASTALISSTVALAAAASYPDPFVSGGSADVAIVYGNSLDLSAVTDISTNIAASTTTTTTGSTEVSGDFIKLEKGSNLYNLGDAMNSIYSRIDESEMEDALAKGEYINDANEDYEYDQEIKLGAHTLSHFESEDLNIPVLGFDLSSGDLMMNYTIDFTPTDAECGTSFIDCETSNLPLMGKEYFVSDISTTTNGWRIDLLDSAVEGIVSEGETTTVTVDGVPYEVSIVFIDSSEVSFSVNGESTNKLSAGDTQKVAGGTAHIGVKEVNKLVVSDSIGSAEFSIGKGELRLENGEEVELNGDTVQDITDSHTVTAYIDNSSATDLDSITLEWTLADDFELTKDSPLTYPVFETFVLSMDDFVPPMEEVTKIDTRGDDSIRITTEVKEGPVSFDILYTDNSTSFDSWHGLGEKSNHLLVTTVNGYDGVTLNETDNSYFVATWINGDDAESYVFEIGSIVLDSGKNKTALNNKATGGSDLTIAKVGDTETVGEIDITLLSASDSGKVATFNLTSSSGSGAVYADRLVTKEGLWIKLPVDSATQTGDGYINISAPGYSTSTYNVNFTEEDDNDNIVGGESFTVRLGFDSNDGVETTLLPDHSEIETEDGSNLYEAYQVSSLATKLLYSNPSSGLGDVEVVYHGSEASFDVYLSQGVTSTSGDSETGGLSVLDSELVSSGMSTKNLIVVGGSCVNSIAAELLGVSAGTCGSGWTSATSAGEGEWVIETFTNPYSDSKVATLVAGWAQGDTSNAATYLRTQDVDTTVGNKYTGTSATSGSMVTA